MKRKQAKGFTLTELLIVIAIIVVLSAVGIGVGKNILFKARASVMANNMKQISSFVTAYATDNQQMLLPCRGDLEQPDGSFDPDALWHEIILSMMFETTDPARFKEESFWDSQELFLENPLFSESASPRGFGPLNPGYGYNLMLPENYRTSEANPAGDEATLERTLVPMAYISDPTRTPIVAPADNYYYRYDEAQIDEFETGTIRGFLVEGRFPVLFIDGHIENVTPQEYLDRRLDEMPLDPDAL
ncbi:MAG: type II secretion system protein [Akkermansiaceae bacterium]|nr:type II secretion system protein [Akkermansiaceae bacterium]